VLQFAQGFGFDLPDPLPGDFKLLPDFLQRMLIAIAQPEAHLQDTSFPVGEGFQGCVNMFSEALMDDRFWRGRQDLVFNEITQRLSSPRR
jgi:hypothetical protein